MAVKSQDKILLRIGTRGSPLAMAQAQMFELKLHSVLRGIRTEIIPIKTSGDWSPADGETRLAADKGGKALFAKEIEEALLKGQVDIAVHSMKDVETKLPKGLTIPCILKREDPRDAFLSNIAQNIYDLPAGSVVGTTSLRRQAFLLAKRPDLKVVPLRGNVDTRIMKLHDKQVDATFLALAGLRRLRKEQMATSIVSIDDMIPAAGQGAVGIQVQSSHQKLISVLSQLSDGMSYVAVACERAVLATVGGGCHTPIGVHAQISGFRVRLRVRLGSPDGRHIFEEDEFMDMNKPEDAVSFGQKVGESLRKKAPPQLLGQK